MATLAVGLAGSLLGMEPSLLVLCMFLAGLLVAGGAWWFGKRRSQAVRAWQAALRTSLDRFSKGSYTYDPPAPQTTVEEFEELFVCMRQLGALLGDRTERLVADCQAQAREERTEALVRFGRGITRDVQQPVAGVIGFVEMAAKQPGATGQLKDYLTLAAKEASSARDALQAILRFCRQDVLQPVFVDLNQVILDAGRGIFKELQAKGLQVHLHLARDLERLEGDPQLLTQVFRILFENARAAMPQAGMLTVSTNLDQQGRLIALVQDDGPGMGELQRSRLFTPYHSTATEQGHRGLSLAIADHLIRLHGGKIEVHSQEGEGSVFYVLLPPAPASATNRII